MKCPKCGVLGAYVGFNSVECRNSKCENFVIHEEPICPCCGISGHIPAPELEKDGKPAPRTASTPGEWLAWWLSGL